MTAEHIPDEDSLYRRIHPEQLKPDGEISSAAFKGDETSVDWAKYATPKKNAARVFPLSSCKHFSRHPPAERPSSETQSY